jgi:hypothetical protein
MPPPQLLGNPKSWKKFVVALLPHNGCYERHTDDHIHNVLSLLIQQSSDSSVTATPRHKSIFQRLDVTNVKAIQAKMKEDEKNGLARKKQQVADQAAAAAERANIAAEKIAAEKKRAQELAKKSKHMSRAAREKQAADSLKRQKEWEDSILDTPSVETDPTGVTGALANIRAPPSPLARGDGETKGSASEVGDVGGGSAMLPVTEDEGAADVIYILTLEDVISKFQQSLPPNADRTEGRFGCCGQRDGRGGPSPPLPPPSSTIFFNVVVVADSSSPSLSPSLSPP